MLMNDRQAPNPPLYPRFKGYFPIYIRAFVPTFLFFLFLYLSSNKKYYKLYFCREIVTKNALRGINPSAHLEHLQP